MAKCLYSKYQNTMSYYNLVSIGRSTAATYRPNWQLKYQMPEIKYVPHIAQWICLRLPSCRPRFESQAHQLRFFQFISFKLYICHLNWNVKEQK